MKHILIHSQNKDDILQYLQLHLNDLKVEQMKAIEKITALTKTIEKMKQEETMVNYQVEVKTIPEKDMMCKRGMIPS